MVKFLLPYFLWAILLRPTYDPFTFLGKTQKEIETVVGKSVKRITEGGNVVQCAYPFTKTGAYTIAYESDTAKAFIWQPSRKTVFLKSQLPPVAFKDADRQPNDGTHLLVSQSKIIVELKGDTVRKITYLP